MSVKNPEKHAGGRPTQYRPEYCEEIIEYFDVAPYTTSVKTITTKNGSIIEEPITLPNDARFMVGFERLIGVSLQTLHNWCKEYPEFLEAFTQAKELQARHVAVNALNGTYNGGFAQFMLMNTAGWRNKSDLEQNVTGDCGVIYLPDTLPAGAPVPKLEGEK